MRNVKNVKLYFKFRIEVLQLLKLKSINKNKLIKWQNHWKQEIKLFTIILKVKANPRVFNNYQI